MENKFNGLYPPDNGLNAACERARKICENDPSKRIIYDIESMWPIVVSKEDYKMYLEMINDTLPRFSPKMKKGVFIYGTGGQMDKNSFQEFWDNIK